MIFVSLGTQDKPFNRIIDYVISLKENLKEIKSEKIIIQLGQTKLLKSDIERIESLENIIIYDMLKPEKMKDIIKDADIIITHAGVGTIMECLERNKEIIVVPRKVENLEHVNNHQEEIAYEMEKQGFLTKVDTYEELENKIMMLLKDKDTNDDKSMNKKKYISNNEKFNDNLIKYLESI